MLRKKNLRKTKDFFDSVPYPFAVPLEEFKKRCFYLPANQFSLQERFCYEHLIETLRKDNEEMKKENEEDLLKHYQSQFINLSLNQSMNQSMSFSQSFLQSRSILGEQPMKT